MKEVKGPDSGKGVDAEVSESSCASNIGETTCLKGLGRPMCWASPILKMSVVGVETTCVGKRGIPAQPQGPSYCKYEWNIQGDLPNYRPVITSSGPRVAAAGLVHSAFLGVLILAAARCLA
ncbi:hypothetical protein Bbelb_230500 [Branchiostoma belcheri]|nr:hypothetical protein Bbelb_230500 [Branchiostoma belcheri]